MVWDIPVSTLPTAEEREVWDRHPHFVSLQRSRDGWAWYTANIGRLLPPFQDIEVEPVENDPTPYIGDAGFYSWRQLPAVVINEVDEPQQEVPFVPDYLMDRDLEPQPPDDSLTRRYKAGGPGPGLHGPR